VSEPAKPPPEGGRLPDTAGVAEPEPLAALPPLRRSAGLPKPPLLEVNAPRIVAAGTALWFAAFLVLLAFRSRLAEDGREGWLWTCLVGAALGLVGLPLALRARSASRRRVSSEGS
jgi:hypothetical protein